MKKKWKELIINLLVIVTVLSITLPFVDYGTNETELIDEFVFEKSNNSFLITGKGVFVNLTLSENFNSAYERYEDIYFGNDSATILLCYEFSQLEEHFVTYTIENQRSLEIYSIIHIMNVYDDEPVFYDSYWWFSEISSLTIVGDGVLLPGAEWVLIDLQVMTR